ncbi:MAG: D-alanyl-D-alanine carboxypeptidase family protein [Sporolactobacillus sp.]
MKSFIVGLTCFILIFCLAGPAMTAHAANRTKAQDKGEGIKSAIVIEEDTGKILYQKNANKELPPASMTKVMTMLLIFKALDAHKLSLHDKVTVSEKAASMGGSQVFLEPGETMTVDEMLRAIAIASGNDASVAMAEHLSGSVQAFVAQMNREARQLGLTHTHFVNPTGLPVANHYTTAHDMAIMARALANYSQVFHYTSKYEDYLRENTDKKFWLVNTNKLIKTYPGADGMKTGFTSEAKYCLTATAKREGMRVIAVVMGAPTPKVRNQEAANLMNQAFAVYTTKEIKKQGQVISNQKIEKGNYSHVPVITQRRAVVLLKKGESLKGIKSQIKWQSKLQAPVKRGTTIGYLIVRKNHKLVSKTPLTVQLTVKRASWWQLFKRSAGTILSH